MSDVNIMKQMRCISNPFFTSERLVGVNYERHLKRIFRFGQNLKKRTLSIGGRWDSMAIIIKTWERFEQKLADESQHSGNHYSWQFAGKSRTCLSLCVFGGHLPHRLECHIEITRLCCQKFLLALLVHFTQEQLFFLPSYQSTHVKFDPNWDKWRRLTAGWRTEQCRQFKLWKVLWGQKHYKQLTEITSSSKDTVEWRLLPPVMGASGGGLRTSETGGEGRILRLTSSSDFSFVLNFICTGWVDG